MNSTPDSLRRLAVAAIMLVIGPSAGCGTSSPPAAKPAVVPSAPVPVTKAVAPPCPVPASALGARPVAKTPDPAKASSAAATDYWKAVKFGRIAFDEMRMYVQYRYIDARINEGRAFAEAATFALRSDRRHELLLLPQAFYEQRCKHPDERGLLSGQVIKLRASDPFVIVVAKTVKRPTTRLTDDAIRALRAKDRQRTASIEAAWKRARFNQRDFLRIMSWAQNRLGADPKWTIKHAWVAAASGYLYSLDPHSSLMPIKAWAEATKRDPSFEGIGAVLTRRPNNDHTIVETPLDGYPAVNAGLRAGDVILKVDSTSTKEMPLPKVVDRIRGKAGTKVVLTVERLGEPKPLAISIVRAKVTIKNVVAGLVPGHSNIGYLKIRGFLATTHQDMMAAMAKLQRKVGAGNLHGLILDLRTNGGGLLNQGVEVANEFLNKGTVVTVRARVRPRVQSYSARSGAYDFPVVVLVNDRSASASEIVAAALQENGRALVVGDRTFGKATVQTLFPPRGSVGYYLKLTIARYHTPTDRRLQAVGVHPDVVIPPTLGGKLPLGFREENLSNHLWKGTRYVAPPARVAYTKTVKTCADKHGKAAQLHANDPNPQIKFDYQRAFAADMVSCMAKHPRVAAQP